MSEEQKNNMTSIVMLGDPNVPSGDTLRRAIQARCPNVLIPPDTSAKGDGAILFFERGAMCSIMRLSAPYPLSQKDAAFTFAWH
jgi:hypothetical protein